MCWSRFSMTVLPEVRRRCSLDLFFQIFVTIPLEIYYAMLFTARAPTFGYFLVALVIGTDA